ncbi:hypothetical protein [Oceanobacillus sp. CAU 1775]
METNRFERLEQIIEEIRDATDEKTVAKLELDRYSRFVIRLEKFSEDCHRCQELTDKMEKQLTSIHEKIDSLTKQDIKEHFKITEEISSHLQKEHKLIPKGYHMGVYMSLGISFGLLVGLIFFDNVAIGLPLGMVIGMAIGMGKDKEEMKKGNVI